MPLSPITDTYSYDDDRNIVGLSRHMPPDDCALIAAGWTPGEEA